MTHRLTVTIPDDLRRSLDRWTTMTRSTDEQAVWIALRMLLCGEPSPPWEAMAGLSRVKAPGSRGSD